MAAPNFRLAYQTDPQFRALALSHLVEFSCLHGEDGGRGAPMNLIAAKDFHLRYNLFYPQEREYYSQSDSDASLNVP